MQIIEVTSLQEECLKPYMERSEKQLLHWNEPELGFFIAESPNVVQRALAAGYEPVSFLLEKGQEKAQVNSFLSDFDVPVFLGEAALLKGMIGYELTRGVLCLMRRKALPTVSNLLEGFERIVVLEDVMNPTNLGAIFRSAAALGLDGVLLTSGCTDPFYRRATRTSMGTVFQVPWSIFPRDVDWMELLQGMGYKTVSMALRDDSISLRDERLQKEEKLAVIMGTEGEGLHQETIDRSDFVVKIPMTHGVDSLNVAAASAVAFWQLGKA